MLSLLSKKSFRSDAFVSCHFVGFVDINHGIITYDLARIFSWSHGDLAVVHSSTAAGSLRLQETVSFVVILSVK